MGRNKRRKLETKSKDQESEEEEEKEWQVELIIDKRIIDGRIEYLLKWENYKM